MMKIASCLLLPFAALTVSCSGIKVQRADPLPPSSQPAKQGVTWGGSPVGKFEVQKGFWCDVRGTSLITFGHSGPTEAVATELAQKKCHDVYKDSKCELISCKPN